MEEIIKKIRISFIHIGFWLLYLFLLFIVLKFMTHGSGNADMNLVRGIFIWFLFLPAVCSYVLYYWLVFKYYLKSKNVGKSFITGFLVSIVNAAIFTFLLELHIRSNFTSQRISSVTFELFLFNVFLCTVVGSIAFILRTFHEWFKDQKLKDSLREQNHKMELKMLKAQLDPHFLFNSLNNIDVLIQKNPTKASNYLNKLSDLLRYTLNPKKVGKVSLNDEIEYIKNYIDLQKIRSAKKDLVEFTIVGGINHMKVHSMLFIPFIENAFKYHQYSNKEAKIHIQIEVVANEITFKCSNHIAKETVGLKSFKLGNELINKRLELLYPNQYELDVDRNKEVYQVKLQLSCF